jgi:FMN phosphatase YigB (HAD superfamily)
MACVFLAHSSGGTDNKDLHFATIKERTGIEYSDMVFFDDGPGNIAGARALGVKAVLCQYPHGLTWAHVEAAL